MAETNSSVLFSARWKGEAPGPDGAVQATLSALIPVALGLRPRDVTGIQRAQVLGHRRLISLLLGFIHGADAPWLDSCDEHRNEGVQGERRTFAAGLCA